MFVSCFMTGYKRWRNLTFMSCFMTGYKRWRNLTFMSCFMTGYKGEEMLEEFNVRVFYDKLEDQNLHLASQLARHGDDLQRFYDRICQQNEELKTMLNDLDLEKLEEIARQRQAASDSLHGNAESVNVINTNITLAGRSYKFTGKPGLRHSQFTQYVCVYFGEYIY